jgi:hypothetical protein
VLLRGVVSLLDSWLCKAARAHVWSAIVSGYRINQVSPKAHVEVFNSSLPKMLKSIAATYKASHSTYEYCAQEHTKCSESTKSLWNIRCTRAVMRVQTRHLPNHVNRILRRALNSVGLWCQDQNPQGTFNTVSTTVASADNGIPWNTTNTISSDGGNLEVVAVADKFEDLEISYKVSYIGETSHKRKPTRTSAI